MELATHVRVEERSGLLDLQFWSRPGSIHKISLRTDVLLDPAEFRHGAAVACPGGSSGGGGVTIPGKHRQHAMRLRWRRVEKPIRLHRTPRQI